MSQETSHQPASPLSGLCLHGGRLTSISADLPLASRTWGHGKQQLLMVTEWEANHMGWDFENKWWEKSRHVYLKDVYSGGRQATATPTTEKPAIVQACHTLSMFAPLPHALTFPCWQCSESHNDGNVLMQKTCIYPTDRSRFVICDGKICVWSFCRCLN